MWALASAQQPGHQKQNAYPPLSIQQCSNSSGDGGASCTTEQKSIVLDSNWMWTHKDGTYINCFTGNAWDPTLCELMVVALAAPACKSLAQRHCQRVAQLSDATYAAHAWTASVVLVVAW